jgi:hypothetical protein
VYVPSIEFDLANMRFMTATCRILFCKYDVLVPPIEFDQAVYSTTTPSDHPNY